MPHVYLRLKIKIIACTLFPGESSLNVIPGCSSACVRQQRPPCCIFRKPHIFPTHSPRNCPLPPSPTLLCASFPIFQIPPSPPPPGIIYHWQYGAASSVTYVVFFISPPTHPTHPCLTCRTERSLWAVKKNNTQKHLLLFLSVLSSIVSLFLMFPAPTLHRSKNGNPVHDNGGQIGPVITLYFLFLILLTPTDSRQSIPWPENNSKHNALLFVRGIFEKPVLIFIYLEV